MKRIIFPLIAIMVCLHANPAHAGFALGSDTMRATSSSSDNSGAWSDWTNCSEAAENTAIRGMNFYSLPDAGNFAKLKMSCREIENDGSFSDNYHIVGPVFTTNESGTLTPAQTAENDYLPVSLHLRFASNGSLVYIVLYGATAEDIVDHNLYYRGENCDDNGGLAHLSASDSNCAYSNTIHAGPHVGSYSGFVDGEKLECRDGYVLTGIRTRTADATWPYNGKVINKISIECTKLAEE